jgi:hypothetical protein
MMIQPRSEKVMKASFADPRNWFDVVRKGVFVLKRFCFCYGGGIFVIIAVSVDAATNVMNSTPSDTPSLHRTPETRLTIIVPNSPGIPAS